MKQLCLLAALAMSTVACGGGGGGGGGGGTLVPGLESPNGAVRVDPTAMTLSTADGHVLSWQEDADGDLNEASFMLNGKPITDARFEEIIFYTGEGETTLSAYALVNGEDGLVFIDNEFQPDFASLEADGFLSLADAGVLGAGPIYLDGIEYIYVLNNSGVAAGSRSGQDGTATINADGSFFADLGDVDIRNGTINGYQMTANAKLASMSGSASGLVGTTGDFSASIGTFIGGDSDNGFAGGWYKEE